MEKLHNDNQFDLGSICGLWKKNCVWEGHCPEHLLGYPAKVHEVCKKIPSVIPISSQLRLQTVIIFGPMCSIQYISHVEFE